MKLKTLEFTPLNEKISFNYTVPKNKKELMYDFYILTSLPLWNLGGVKGTLRPQPEAAAMEMLAKDAQNKLVKYLKNDLLDAVYFAIASEFRHVFAFTTYQEIEKLLGAKYTKSYITNLNIMKKGWYQKVTDPDGDGYVVSYFNNSEIASDFFFDENARKLSYLALKKTFSSDEKFINIAAKIFMHKMWTYKQSYSNKRRWGDYGGLAWANIAKGWIKLNNANSYNDMVVYIDHIFDLQHNTDSVLNKSKAYADSSGKHMWIGYALEDKKHAKSLFELVDKASPSVKSFSARVIKAATGETYEKWLKSIRV